MEGARERVRDGGSREVIVLFIIVHRRSCNVTLHGWPTDSTSKTTTPSVLRRLDLLLP